MAKAFLKTVHFTTNLKPKKALISTSTGSVHVEWKNIAGDLVWSTSGKGDKLQACDLINQLNKWDSLKKINPKVFS